jgi:hypothetical protein
LPHNGSARAVQRHVRTDVDTAEHVRAGAAAPAAGAQRVGRLRPVYHRLEDRIRAHILLCRPALLLVRVAETTTGQTWPAIRATLDRLHLITVTGRAGTFRQTTEPTKPQRDLFTALALEHPRRSSRSPPPTRSRRPGAVDAPVA